MWLGCCSEQSRNAILSRLHIIINAYNHSVRKVLILQTPSEGSKLAAATRSSRRAVAPAVCQVHVKEAENRNTDIPACNREDTAHDKGPTQLHLGQRERERAVPIQQHNAPVVIRQTRSLLCRPPVVGYVNIPLPGAPARLYSDPRQEVISCATSASAFLSLRWLDVPGGLPDQRRALDGRAACRAWKAETGKQHC